MRKMFAVSPFSDSSKLHRYKLYDEDESMERKTIYWKHIISYFSFLKGKISHSVLLSQIQPTTSEEWTWTFWQCKQSLQKYSRALKDHFHPIYDWKIVGYLQMKAFICPTRIMRMVGRFSFLPQLSVQFSPWVSIHWWMSSNTLLMLIKPRLQCTADRHSTPTPIVHINKPKLSKSHCEMYHVYLEFGVLDQQWLQPASKRFIYLDWLQISRQ